MNPPSALHGAMSRDRKPFTYTPGGLDLSEIKSQRMAQRLMRNAMNPGVSEVAVNSALPYSTPTTSIALPNFNCLPVQVFPEMPPNPKTLLRTRSNPDPRQAPIHGLNRPAFVNNTKLESQDIMNSYENKPTYSKQLNNNRPMSMYEYSIQPINNSNTLSQSLGCDGYTAPSFVNTPTPAYSSVLNPTSTTGAIPAATESGCVSSLSDMNFDAKFIRATKIDDEPINGNSQLQRSLLEDKISPNHNVETNIDMKVYHIEDMSDKLKISEKVNSMNKDSITSVTLATKMVEDNTDINNEQKEVRIVKKQATEKKKVEEQNGNQNGDSNEEAEMTIKLPTKKAGAKTETTVEVEKKALPDGTLEEIKTTITKTTVDGRTEIKTKKETKIIPKAEEYEEEVEEEEEEEDTEENIKEKVEEQNKEVITAPETVIEIKNTAKENGDILQTEEKSETTIAKKVVVIQEIEPEETEEVEEEEEESEDEEVKDTEPAAVVPKKLTTPEPEVETNQVTNEKINDKEKGIEEKMIENEVKEEIEQEIEDEDDLEEKEVEKEDEVEKDGETEREEADQVKEEFKESLVEDKEEEQEEEEEYEEAEEENQELKAVEKTEEKGFDQQKEEGTEEIIEKEELVEKKEVVVKEEDVSEKSDERPEQTTIVEEHVIPVQISTQEESKRKEETQSEKSVEFNIPIREPSIPLEKVEDVEIKPISMTPIITKTHTENTEIISSNIDPSGGLSRQTEYNKIENIVTINRTTKILDHNYENLTQQGIPTVKTYFPPPNIDKISTSPTPSRPYQSVYAPESTNERRHSLLLERLSMERQMPSEIYQYSHQSHEQTQYPDEPQSEILTVSNVKPSSITNQQWYQQTKQTQNVLYNNVTSTPTPVGAPWSQPKSPLPQSQCQPQSQYQPPPQQLYQTQYQAPSQPQSQFRRSSTPQPQYQKAAPQPLYQPTYTETTRERIPAKSYTYTPTSTWSGSTIDTTTNKYSYESKDTQNYQKDTINSSTQQYTSGYVPPPWEQDSSYTSVNNISEKYYQEIPQTHTFSPPSSQGWKSAPPAKFMKPAPIAYVPPAPNQSFVKTSSNVEPPKQPGRKTYYSEYERRYITVPESTYIPTETKFQPQPDPSPQHYYDNNEPPENVEPQWRKELREFTEKTSQTTTEQTDVRPPWEVDSKYAKTPSSTYTPTPTWSQTLRPQSYRKRSFESEFVSQEWPKTNTLGRGRPLSTIGKSFDGTAPERVRGVSVDRYNPNNYQPPAEHPPVQSHTLTAPLPHTGYHNPNVPAYHARASAEPREQPANYQQRVYREARASPLQSRSFKYLQWITGTEN